MDFFARQNLIISSDTANLIKNIKILVIGVGAGGNEVLKNLLLMGFGNLTIVDFDHVEDSNLSRTTLFRKEDIGKSKSLVAAERLKEMALHNHPNIVGLHGNLMTDFGKGLFIEHDIVICCVDTQKCRAYINDWCVRTRTPFFEMGFSDYDVDISFFAPEGKMTQRDGKQISKLPSSDGLFPIFNSDFSVCLREEIGFGSFDEKRNSCSNMKEKDENLEKIPTIQVSAAMAGVLVATELVKFLSGIDTLRNKMLLYYGRIFQTQICQYKRHPKCTIHDEKFEIIEIIDKGEITVAELSNAIEAKTGKVAFLKLRDRFVTTGKCHICGETRAINKYRTDMWNDERWCEHCRNTYPNYLQLIKYANDFETIPKEISLTKCDNSVLNRSLKSLSIPENDILECNLIGNGQFTLAYVYIKSNR